MGEMDRLGQDEMMPIKKLWACLPAGPLERPLRWGGRRGSERRSVMDPHWEENLSWRNYSLEASADYPYRCIYLKKVASIQKFSLN
jgi:hypothetical protein